MEHTHLNTDQDSVGGRGKQSFGEEVEDTPLCPLAFIEAALLSCPLASNFWANTSHSPHPDVIIWGQLGCFLLVESVPGGLVSFYFLFGLMLMKWTKWVPPDTSLQVEIHTWCRSGNRTWLRSLQARTQQVLSPALPLRCLKKKKHFSSLLAMLYGSVSPACRIPVRGSESTLLFLKRGGCLCHFEG